MRTSRSTRTKNVVRGNRCVGETAKIRNRAGAKLEDNEGYEVAGEG